MIKISNHDIRLLWLKSNGLLNTNNQKLDVLQIIKELGFVQLDSIPNVTRAHHHILWSRNKKYKEYMLDDLLLEKGNIFEHFTHDASVLPVEFYPFWKGHFKRTKERLDKSKYYKDILDDEGIESILTKIKSQGAVHSQDFDNSTKVEKSMWSRSTYKTTLDYMWYCGILATAHRKSFRKYYNLSENIIPNDILKQDISESEQINWLCMEALNRMSVASAKEIKNFWGSLSTKEVNTWIKENEENLVKVQWENSEGKYINSFAPLDIEDRLEDLKNSKSNSKIRIINPFDPAIRDRVRFKNIFDFDYKIEIFVPKEKRIWGYYVYPILQGNKFIGRIELKADRKAKSLDVLNFWKEDDVGWNEKQQLKLDEELTSLALLVDIKNVNWLK
ncbi:winged helix-turn-helix domain-containing protein [Poseidonibacter lekithochrous]|uniref:winged helix-turn-helix domain-containing protein n=1 Tax=Poseidonibacter lekithochrous TaxID=1904463 RepID=UPI0008FCDD98|nr:crosslink repair DNA glycosylase YcaQ family protein [Poseidonibacter lekithochrous]QKJ23571.1 winged helix-turn-helix domain-containing protein [Poseidonibacter lekithochrous]